MFHAPSDWTWPAVPPKVDVNSAALSKRRVDAYYAFSTYHRALSSSGSLIQMKLNSRIPSGPVSECEL